MFGEEWLIELDRMESVETQWKYLLNKLRDAELECVPSKMIDKYAGVYKHQKTNMDKLTAAAARKKRMWQRYLEMRDPVKYKEYTKRRNKVRAVSRKPKKDAEKDAKDA